MRTVTRSRGGVACVGRGVGATWERVYVGAWVCMHGETVVHQTRVDMMDLVIVVVVVVAFGGR